jgi:hypothetical protein
VSLQIRVNLAELYRKLCKKCQKELIHAAQSSFNEAAVKQALGITEGSEIPPQEGEVA